MRRIFCYPFYVFCFYKTLKVNENENEIEFSNGGGDGGNGFNRFGGFVKSQSFSRVCYPDPENPGKMICKESNNSQGYNPYDPNDKKVSYSLIIIKYH